MPVEDLGKGLLTSALNGVAVARDQRVEVPTVNALDTLVEARAILVAVADCEPYQSLVTFSWAGRRVEAVEDLLEQAASVLLLGHLGVLLSGR
ncbi:hypothetical protein RRF57_008011 [Xylaria bambusicola]|uniref:Uncharacterized protein n=1 Tax=Xylaria bambusicola TaxID=326684 RepID=A0AAN7Z6Q6_9PEZI